VRGLIELSLPNYPRNYEPHFKSFKIAEMIKIYSNLDYLNQFAAEKFIQIGTKAIEKSGKFTVALAGGSTPKSLYQLLTTDKFCSQIDWSKVFFFFGDERNVLPNREESNFRMVYENLLKPLRIAEDQIFRWQTELEDVEKIAADYEEKIKVFFDLKENEFPRFDLILLGIGDDGHTASLFPLTEALDETKKIAVANWVEKLNTNRLTFSFTTINNASNIVFLVVDAAKAEVLREIIKGDFEPEKFPAQNIKLKHGNLLWLIDEKAAQNL
jgi:6-phosphogluconolactonase